jgi:acetyl esterase/lipase
MIRQPKLRASICFLFLAAVPASSQEDARATVDSTGNAHLPQGEVPYSNLASPGLRDQFTNYIQTLENRGKAIEAAKTQLQPGETLIQAQRRIVDTQAKENLSRLREIFDVEIRSELIDGIQTDIVKRAAGGSPRNRERILINLHGGGFAVGGRYVGQLESVPITATGGFTIVTVDYRMGPEHRFPAASVDVTKVYESLLRSYRPENIGIYGCSAGAMLTAQSVAWLRHEGLPKPGAVAMLSGGAVIDRWGDSNYVSAALGGYGMPAFAPGQNSWEYFAGANLSDPLISPGHSDAVLKDFPPSLFINGIRDLTLSGALYSHSRLVDLNVPAELHVWEGAAHCFTDWDSPESRQAWRVVIRFFDQHLGTRAK